MLTVTVPTVTETVCAPTAADAGIVITLAIVPPVPVCAPLFGVNTVVSNLKTIGVLTGKLAPVIVTREPAAPEAGVNVSIVGGEVTVKVAVAEELPAVTVIV